MSFSIAWLLIFSFILVECASFDEPIYSTDLNFWGVQHVTVNDEIKFSKTFGYANAKWSIPHSLDSRFHIASNTKLFAAVAIYQLDENGILNISEPISHYLDVNDLIAFGYDFESQPPNISNNTYCPRLLNSTECQDITFADLMAHNSGLLAVIRCTYSDDSIYKQYCWDICDSLFAPYTGNVTNSFRNFINLPLEFKPGIYNETKTSYCNTNYLLLQYFIEKYSMRSFGDYVYEYITEPLGLENTYFDPFDGAIGINKNSADGWFRIPWPNNDNSTTSDSMYDVAKCQEFDAGSMGASGGMVSSNQDLHKWYKALFNNSDGYIPPIFQYESTVQRMLGKYTFYGVVNGGKVYFGHGIITLFNDVDSAWPDLILYEGGSFCSSTSIVLKTDSSVAGKGDMTIATVFENAKTFYVDIDGDTGTITMDGNDMQYGVCTLWVASGHVIIRSEVALNAAIGFAMTDWSNTTYTIATTGKPLANTTIVKEEGCVDDDEKWFIIGIIFICLFSVTFVIAVYQTFLLKKKASVQGGEYGHAGNTEMGHATGYTHAATATN